MLQGAAGEDQVGVRQLAGARQRGFLGEGGLRTRTGNASGGVTSIQRSAPRASPTVASKPIWPVQNALAVDHHHGLPTPPLMSGPFDLLPAAAGSPTLTWRHRPYPSAPLGSFTWR